MTKTEIADEIDRIKQIVEKLDAAITKLAIAVEKDEEDEKAAKAFVEKPKAEKKAKPLTLEDVRAKLTTLAGSKGGAAVKALLKDFGAEKLSDIAAQDYPELLAKAEELAND